ncbi:MAG: 5-formyltetrahydrofolate cyclo-ligase, partial [Candidatus Omnitrophica bacterium]|nr:5-formyltetrahydrofolate cyclo-ligase [Candidatus Omnitrophota bacterium]
KRRSQNVENRLEDLPEYKKAKNVMVYYPLKGEVNILEMIRKAMRYKRFFFPVMELKSKNLRIFEVSNLDKDFILGPYGVREPDTKKTREAVMSEIDMVIVPGLGFDRQKNRLGRGAGFYDRFLKKITSPVTKVGIAFDLQILENLPVNLSFDQKIDILVSENFII